MTSVEEIIYEPLNYAVFQTSRCFSSFIELFTERPSLPYCKLLVFRLQIGAYFIHIHNKTIKAHL